MQFKNLDSLANGNEAVLTCHLADNPSEQEIIQIEHLIEPAVEKNVLDALKAEFREIPDLIELFSRFGGLTLFRDVESDEAVYSIASPEHWDALQSDFEFWIKDVEGREREETLPPWMDSVQVIGERPGSACYFLIPTKGDSIGQVFEFDHDGLEFYHRSNTIIGFVEKISAVDDKDNMKNVASDLRHIDFDSKDERWSVAEYKDRNRTISLNDDAGCYTLKIVCTQNRLEPTEKNTQLAKFALVPVEEYELHTLEHTVVELPGNRKIVVVSEVTQYESHISISKRDETSIYGGEPLFSAYATTEINLQFRFDDEIFLTFELELQT